MRKNSPLDFEAVVETYYEHVFALAVRLCGKLERALALTQHTFCLALHHRGVRRGPGKARKWLLTILFREFLKEARSGSPAELSADLNRMPTLLGDGKPSEAEALVMLDEQVRIPLALFYLRDFSCSQIADYLNLSIEEVLLRLAKGREQFHRALTGHLGDDPQTRSNAFRAKRAFKPIALAA